MRIWAAVGPGPSLPMGEEFVWALVGSSGLLRPLVGVRPPLESWLRRHTHTHTHGRDWEGMCHDLDRWSCRCVQL